MLKFQKLNKKWNKQEVPRSLFSVYEPFHRQESFFGEEYLLFFESLRQSIPRLEVQRFDSGKYYRDIDNTGVWHEHNLDRVRAYLKHPHGRWRVTLRRVLAQPQKSLPLLLKWLVFRLRNGGVESLPKRLAEV